MLWWKGQKQRVIIKTDIQYRTTELYRTDIIQNAMHKSHKCTTSTNTSQSSQKAAKLTSLEIQGLFYSKLILLF